MKILVLDNYDSFTYNLVHMLEKLTDDPIDVFRNDKIDLEEVAAYDKIVLSPGPGIPSEAGILMDVIRQYAPTKNILGVCLGHQAIGEVFGAELFNLSKVYHGISTNARIIDYDIIFNEIPEQFEIGRYHSWCLRAPLPSDLIATMVDEEGHIMALKHATYNVRGVQFHPESVLTPLGEKLLENWIKLA